VTFQFQPNRCDQTCSCNKVAMAQALRLKRPDNSDIPLSDAQSARTVHNTSEPILDGWAIDRDKNAETGTEWLWGFYGMNDDGSFDSEKASRGDNATPAKLTDSPGTKLEKSYSVEVIDVPVCLDDRSPCFQRALGYFVWGWSVGGSTLQRAPECDAGQGWFALCGALAPTMCERMPHAKAEIGILYYKKAFCLALQAWNDNLGPRHPFTAELLADVCSGT
ncbi:MAG TPA: hypothetical protein VLF14_11055, partial [Candidatus Binatia bacterium]|nr:hypothetical protein [Candidatus Binatia bacterium]